MRYFPGKEWYAIRIKYRHEQIVEKSLSNKELPPLNLTYQKLSKQKDRKKTLTQSFFPGYMFIKTELDAGLHVEILKTFGIVEIIKNSEGPIPISEAQIQNIQKLEKYTGEIITLNEFATGMMVQVINGSLKGLMGRIDEMHKKFIKLSIDSVPGSVAIQAPYADLKPVEKSESLAHLF